MNKEASPIIEKIETIRKANGLTKQRLSEILDIKPQTYQNYLGRQKSKPSVDLIIKVICEFSVNPYWLLLNTDGPKYAYESDDNLYSKVYRVADENGKCDLSGDKHSRAIALFAEAMALYADEITHHTDEVAEKLRELDETSLDDALETLDYLGKIIKGIKKERF